MGAYGTRVAGRMRAAMRNPEVAERFARSGAEFTIPRKATPSEALKFLCITGIDARLLLCDLENVQRRLDDLPSVDTHRGADGNEA